MMYRASQDAMSPSKHSWAYWFRSGSFPSPSGGRVAGGMWPVAPPVFALLVVESSLVLVSSLLVVDDSARLADATVALRLAARDAASFFRPRVNHRAAPTAASTTTPARTSAMTVFRLFFGGGPPGGPPGAPGCHQACSPYPG